MNIGCFPRLFVLLLALVIALSFAGCDIDLPGFGGSSFGQEHPNDEVMSEMVIPGDDGQGDSFVIGGDGISIGGNQVIIGGFEGDYSGYVNEDGCIVFSKLMSAEGVLQETEFAVPAYPDGTLMIEFDYQIILSPDGSLILYVDALSDMLGDSDEGPVDDGGYKLPNGDSVNPQSVKEDSDGRVYVDYDFTHRSNFGGLVPAVVSENSYDCVGGRVYLVDEEKYAIVCFYDVTNSGRTLEESPAYRLTLLEWDNDIDYYNDILIKGEWYLREDQFLLSSKEFVYDSDGGDSLVLVAANGKEYDFYEQRYDYTYYEYGVRVADAYNFPTKEVRYEGNTNKLLYNYESTYNAQCYLINWKQIDENGVVYWEVNYAGDGNAQILNTVERRPWEGFEIYTEYEDGMMKIAYQTFENCPGVKDGTKYICYYTDDVATHYDEFDPDGVLVCTMYYDEDYNYTRAVYYDKEGNIIKDVHYD